jgi:hypothetical protein
MMSPDKLKPLHSVLTYMGELTQDELGFDLGFEELAQAPGGVNSETPEDQTVGEEGEEALLELRREHRRKLKEANRPL